MTAGYDLRVTDNASQATFDEVLARFRLSAPRIEPLAGGTMTLASLVTSTSADQFVLRQVRNGAAEYAAARHHLLDYLASGFGKAPVPVQVSAGGTLVTVDGRAFELLTYVPGGVAHTPDAFDFDDDGLLVSAAGLLGELHRSVSTYIPPATAAWPQAYWRIPPGEQLDWDIAAHRLSGIRTSPASELLAALPTLKQRSAQNDRWAHLCTPAIVHNDYGWYNLVTQAHRAVGVIDFDEARVDCLLHDLAWAIYAFVPVVPRVNNQARSWQRLVERVHLFLHAYQAEVTLDTVHLASLPLAIEQRQLQAILKGIWAVTRPTAPAAGFLAQTSDNVEWLHWYDDMRDQLAKSLRMHG